MGTRRIATTRSKYVLTLLNVTTQPLLLERVLYAGGHFQTYLSSTAIWNQRNRGGGLISKAAMNSMLVINTLYSGLWLQIFPPPCSCSSCRQCLSLCAAKNSRSSGASWTFLQQEKPPSRRNTTLQKWRLWVPKARQLQTRPRGYIIKK